MIFLIDTCIIFQKCSCYVECTGSVILGVINAFYYQPKKYIPLLDITLDFHKHSTIKIFTRFSLKLFLYLIKIWVHGYIPQVPCEPCHQYCNCKLIEMSHYNSYLCTTWTIVTCFSQCYHDRRGRSNYLRVTMPIYGANICTL